jgi:pantothenate kinase
MEHKKQSREILKNLLAKHTNNMNSTKKTFRIGLSGAPGVGKSTFIESFGMHLINQGFKVAVLVISILLKVFLFVYWFVNRLSILVQHELEGLYWVTKLECQSLVNMITPMLDQVLVEGLWVVLRGIQMKLFYFVKVIYISFDDELY